MSTVSTGSDPKLPPYTKFCKCSACGRYFTNVTAFDIHRHGSPERRECRDPGTILTKKGKARLRLTCAGYWQRVGKDERFSGA